MVLEEQRNLHEDIERLEQAIADRYLEQPKQDRVRLNRDHEMAQLLDSLQSQSRQLLQLYKTQSDARTKEIQDLSLGDSIGAFMKQVGNIKEYHRRYPNQPAENLELAYKRGGMDAERPSMVNGMFSGEEFFGKYFDMYDLHDRYVNLPSLKNARRITYRQYLDSFDDFSSMRKSDKMSEEYLAYLRGLTTYLEEFMTKTKPLESLDKLFSQFGEEFEKAWEAGEVPGWGKSAAEAEDSSSTWCQACEKEFGSENTYAAHLKGKKHIRNAATRQEAANGTVNGASHGSGSLREKAIAEREFRARKLAGAMQTVRGDTRDNVERKAAMTDRERAQELDALYEDREEEEAQDGAEDGDDGKIYNPLKLPLDWSGKPIPFWLYKLHGLGVEFDCEVCGNFTYMGRRAFDKHFNEPRHVYGLKCLGITNSNLFRDITQIDEAQKLWSKLQDNKKVEKKQTEGVVEMEDSQGNVMPEKVYNDLRKQGMI